jgi:site-specific recombinase XerD
MDVIYFFCESASVRVPLFAYDQDLFNRFVRGGGFWDRERQEFIFRRDVNAEKLNGFLPAVPCVWAEELFPAQVRVFGFLERTCKNPNGSAENAHNDSRVEKTDGANSGSIETACRPFDFPHRLSLPEKLSEQWRNKLEATLRSRKYSPRTQKAYIYYNRLLCLTLQKPPEEITPDDITEFLAIMEKSKEYSSSSINLAISSIKFFFRHILKNDKIGEQYRPRHDKTLPMILSKEEIVKVLGTEENPKHRLLLMLAYSSGLRVSEVVALKKEHVDLSRKVIYIRLGKGRKDRNTLLSEKAAQFIEEYYKFFDIQKWLFPGQPSDRHLTIRSAQHIFDKAVCRAGITKKITIHGLRHTFATHLLESGTDIRYIQTLLGHSNIRTTERYTHVAKRNVLSIKSPLDTI